MQQFALSPEKKDRLVIDIHVKRHFSSGPLVSYPADLFKFPLQIFQLIFSFL